MMKKHEKAILFLVLTQAVVFAGLYRTRSAAIANSVPVPRLLKVSPQTLIGDEKQLEGNGEASYTLVEFGDYQCPPCAQMCVQVKSLLSEYPDKLRFRFRHFPLQMHEYAMNGAIAAEEARTLGHFEEVHERLYSLKTKIAPEQVTITLAQLHLDVTHLSRKQIKDAENRVQADIRLADTVALDSTPTFLLCCPDGRVLKLGALSQAETLLQ